MKLNEVTENNYFVFDVEWSQTDKDTYIVKAGSKSEAEKIAKSKFIREDGRGARYVNFVRAAQMLS